MKCKSFFVNYLMLAVVLLLTASGCGGSAGNQKLAKLKDGDVATMLIKGKTTSDEVKAKLGDPSDIDFDNHGHKKWTYTHVKSSLTATSYIPVVSWVSHGTNDTTKKVVIVFDKNDCVLDYLVTQTKGKTNLGLVH